MKAVAQSLTLRNLLYGFKNPGTCPFRNSVVFRMYSSEGRHYDLFESIRGKEKGGGEGDSRKAWESDEEEGCLWTGSSDGEGEGERDGEKDWEKDWEKGWKRRMKREMKNMEKEGAENSMRIDADDSEELRSVFSGSESDKSLWTGGDEDSDRDAPTEPFPNEVSDRHLDKLFDLKPGGKLKYKSFSEALKSAYTDTNTEDMMPGKQARKAAVEKALRKLRKGPDGRYVNVWEVMSDLDILIGAFDNLVSGPEYEEMRKGGPKKLDINFFKDIQAKMRDPSYKFSPEYKLKPRSRFVSRAKWQKTESKRRKAARR